MYAPPAHPVRFPKMTSEVRREPSKIANLSSSAWDQLNCPEVAGVTLFENVVFAMRKGKCKQAEEAHHVIHPNFMQTYNQLLHKPTTYVCSKRVFRRCKIEWWEKNTRWPVIGIDGWCVQSKAFANALLLLNVGLALCPRLHSPVWAFGLSLRGGILPYWAFSTGSNYVISTRHFKNPIALELCNTFSSLIRLTPHCWELKKGKLLLILKYKSWMRDFFRKSLPGKNTNLMRKVVVDDSNSDHLESQFRG